jgi:hypothetical protein
MYYKGRAMAQVVSRRPLTAEARVRSLVNPCEICGGQSGTGTGFFWSTSVFPLSISFHRCSITRKNERKLIFITGLQNKPQGCGASVAFAAERSIKKSYYNSPSTKVPSSGGHWIYIPLYRTPP